jgi:hypothetical protein
VALKLSEGNICERRPPSSPISEDGPRELRKIFLFVKVNYVIFKGKIMLMNHYFNISKKYKSLKSQ